MRGDPQPAVNNKTAEKRIKYTDRHFNGCPVLDEVVVGGGDPEPASPRPATVFSCRRADLFILILPDLLPAFQAG